MSRGAVAVASRSLEENAPELGPALGASVHRPPRARLVDRMSFVTSYIRGKDVIDLGFVDQSRMTTKHALGTWLHAEVAANAASVVGIDADAEGVERARELGFAAYRADCEAESELRSLGLEPADVVLAGELLEHLDRPGSFLEAAKVLVRPAGTLLITTPNALSLTNFVSSAMHRELVNPDHVAWFSWHTLETLLARHSWKIVDLAYYGFPRVPITAAARRGDRIRARTFNGYQRTARPLFRLRPTLADGIIVVAAPALQPAG